MGKSAKAVFSIGSVSHGEPIVVAEECLEKTIRKKFCPGCGRAYPMTTNYWYWYKRSKPKCPSWELGQWEDYCKECRKARNRMRNV
jgi:hypothetical protein